MRIYLAHPVTDYGTERQAAAVSLISSRGWLVENPDKPHHEAAYKMRGMQHFVGVVEDCDGLAFLRFDDETIGAGVAKEIETALRRGLPVWDASSGELLSIGLMMPYPVLTVEQTRAKLAEIRSAGQRQRHCTDPSRRLRYNQLSRSVRSSACSISNPS